MTGLVDRWGNPLKKQLLQREVSGPTLAGVRQPVTGYPGDGLTPVRLARILREADMGEPLSYFELAEQIEERDLHYAGVLATRKRSVSQVDITVEAASDGAEDVRRADLVRTWLKRDELSGELFDILDAVGKGLSFTEIVWDFSEGQYQPSSLEWRDARWFRPDRDGVTPLLRGGIDGHGQDEPLPAFKFIRHEVKAKSGLPVRSGIARLATWNWMFKAYTMRDWAVFTQTYGQPLRLGKFGPGASSEDKDTLFRAVANIAGDCAAIIPEGMSMDFVEAKNVGTGSDLYEKRADWLDRQMSKAVLGQTTTTDAVSGGHAVSQEHREVQEDIETADCKGLSGTLNRDLIRPWMDLEFGPPTGDVGYPRLVIARPKQEDLQLLSSSLAQLVPMGLRVKQAEIRDKFGLADPEDDDELLRPAQTQSAPEAPAMTALQARDDRPAKHPARQAAEAAAAGAEGAVAAMVDTIEAMMSKAADLGELREMLASGFPEVSTEQLGTALAQAMTVSHLAGRSDLLDESA
ncbi:DUF935 domain-containing protein [Aurantiacibacter xanthus]|uniref:DUF935 domain-containing protein n=1 Tax=Aurantiacibacter xanthus TaxID=1784712 RepID=A0A3A1P6J7_9SPHN|nr:DUF935 domain-containing protein [Aurantiacibacter xanthus]RIV82961.1 DUF935 domain-containing protein [Aurantiacibacter xanthus]